MQRSKFAFLLLVLTTSFSGFAQSPYLYPQRNPMRVQPAYSAGGQTINDQLRSAGPYSGSALSTPFAAGNGVDNPEQMMRHAAALAAEERQNEYDAYIQRERRRKAAEEKALLAPMQQPQAHADPEAPDQSELLRNSKDPDFILRNFHTMYVDAHDAKYFGSDQMKAALGRNKDFQKLNIHIVDDPRVADTVLTISYTFAWDFPFQLRHQNTTIVLLSGKGEGPFSGPLGAADVARQFTKAAKSWRKKKEKANH